MTGDSLFWGLYLLAGVGYELVAVFNRRRGDTLTETIKPIINVSSFTKFAALGVLLWLPYHFLVEG